MSEDPRGVIPLDWPGLVRESVRRRKSEKMTQRDHAALAGVSVPTIVAFDRAETTLTLAKAFDILRVVGLVETKALASSQDAFVRDACERWRQLISTMPTGSAARCPHGWYRVDYELAGAVRPVTMSQLKDALSDAEPSRTGWPLFVCPTRAGLAPSEQDGAIECWVKPEQGRGGRSDAAHGDFWRVSPSGRAMTIRGYQEDGEETFPPGTIFDTTLPIWRLAEALTHASRLAQRLAADPETTQVRLRVLYTGLSGRVLKSWANPLSDLFIAGGAARSDEAHLQMSAAAAQIEDQLPQLVHRMAASLFERFGVAGLSLARVQAEIDKIKNRRLR